MISKLRERIGFLQNILAWPFIKLKISPNAISVIGLVLALIGVYFVTRQNWLLAFVFFLLAPTMDLIDGTVARALNKKSNWGNYFETMIDKIVDFAMLGSFVLFFPVASVLAVGFSALSSYAKPRVGLIIITDNHDWPAIGEHADKLLIILLVLLCASFGFTSLFGYNVIEIGLYLIALISGVGAIQRIIYAKKLIKKAEKEGTLLPYIKNKKER
ncbi:MAG: CDP-alcohol phosphatidyltransferase family protein [archaeon]|jgi:phosphatidylglycerophosphate synthase